MSDIEQEIHDVTNELVALTGERQRLAQEISRLDEEIVSGPERAEELRQIQSKLRLRMESIPAALKDAQEQRQRLVRLQSRID